LRRQLLQGVEQKELILEDYVADMLGQLMDKYIPEKAHADDWDTEGLRKEVLSRFGVDVAAEGVDMTVLNRQELGDGVFEKLKARYESKERMIGAEQMRYHERMLMLSIIDQQWKEHLLNMDHLREGIGLRGYAQHDPLVEYKRESFDMFEAMMQRFQEETVRYLYTLQMVDAATGRPVEMQAEQPDGGGNGASRVNQRAQTTIDEIEAEFQRKKKRELEQARMAGSGDQTPVQQVKREGSKVGRNDPCPCGSGKKFKKCHGAAA
jgi:preprotein translocase subunit SecA